MKTIKRVLISIIIIIVIFMVFYAVDKNNASAKELHAQALLQVKEALYAHLNNMIRNNEEFYKDYIIETPHMIYFTHYYKAVLCHKDLCNMFLDSIPLVSILQEKSTMAEKLIYIESLFRHYVIQQSLVISDLVTFSAQKNMAIVNKKDVHLILLEYAKLLPMSKVKYSIVTSKVFLESFLSFLDWDTYKNTADFRLNNLALLKQYYYQKITSLHVDYGKILLEDISNISRKAIFLGAHISVCAMINVMEIINMKLTYLQESTPEILSNLTEMATPLVVPNIEDHLFTERALPIYQDLFLRLQYWKIVYSSVIITCKTILYIIILWIFRIY